MKRTRYRAGSRWRVLAHRKGVPVQLKDDGVFDELVVDNWLHVEQMSTRAWWMQVGPLRIDVQLRPDGKVNIVAHSDTGPRGSVDINGVIPGEQPGEEREPWWRREKK